MDTETKENRKVREVLSIVFGVILIALGLIFVYGTDFKRSLPLGVILIYCGALFIVLTDVPAIFFPSMDEPMFFTKKVRLFVACIIGVCLLGVSGYDFVRGPQETVLEQPYISRKSEKIRKKKRVSVTYLKGKTEAGKDVKILVKGEENKEEVSDIVLEELSEGNNKIIVSYYKGLRIFYDIKGAD